MNSKQFVAKIVADNQALFQASQHNVKAYFDSKPAQEELVAHFIGRMVNERMNMVEISQAIAQMPADADPVALAAYQLVAEGRAEAVWNTMAECVEDEFIRKSYAKIAKDEGFHSKIGARKLEQLVTDAEIAAKVETLVAAMRKDLYEISCKNTVAAQAGRELVADAYGW